MQVRDFLFASKNLIDLTVTHTQNHFTAIFLELPGGAGVRRDLLDFVVHGNRKTH